MSPAAIAVSLDQPQWVRKLFRRFCWGVGTGECVVFGDVSEDAKEESRNTLIWCCSRPCGGLGSRFEGRGGVVLSSVRMLRAWKDRRASESLKRKRWGSLWMTGIRPRSGGEIG